MLAHEVSTLGELFRKRVEQSSAQECYQIKRNGRWEATDWRSFGAEIEALANGLLQTGWSRGDTVAIIGATCPEWCTIDMAAILLGGRTVGIYDTLLVDQIQYILEDSSARYLFLRGDSRLHELRPLLDSVASLERIVVWDSETAAAPGVTPLDELLQTDPSSSAAVDAAAAEVANDDVALVVYTSGTTGQPKGVPLTHANVLAQLRAGNDLVGEVGPKDITISFLPMAHVAEHVPGFFGRLNTGMRTAFATSYETLIDELTEVRPTYFGAVPRIFEKMYGRIHEKVAQANPRRQAIFRAVKNLAIRRARAVMTGTTPSLGDRIFYPLADRLVYRKIRQVFGGRVKAFITGAAPIDQEILEFFYGVGMKIIEVYGLSEATAISFANTLERQQLGTVGWPIDGVEYKLDHDGEILLRGPTVFSGYLNLSEENEHLFTEEGYLRTGDIGEITEDGCLRIKDRKKNLIKTSGGKYVVPTRLEALVKGEPLVSQAYIHGDNRPFVVALITLDEQEAARVAGELGIEIGDLSEHPDTQRRVGAAVEKANGRLARFEQIKRHAILPRDFSLEDGTLTPTMKLKRRVVAERYASEIDALYAEAKSNFEMSASA